MSTKECVPVSESTPFLSNLNVLSNIMLVQEIHEYWFKEKAKAKALEKLEQLGLSHLATLHHTKLGRRNSFYIGLIRASMLDDKQIVIDRPFVFLPTQSNLQFLYTALEKLNVVQERVTIIDLVTMEERYKESECHIEKC